MRIRRNGMKYVSKKKVGKLLLCSAALKGVGVQLYQMGLRGILICHFVKIKMYMAAEIHVIIIYQDFFSKQCIFFYNLNHFIIRALSPSYNQIHPL